MREGEVLDGRYCINRLLGKGGMSAVYQGQDVSTGEFLALKVSGGICGPVLRREYELLRRLEYGGVVSVRECFRSSDQEILVMECIEGEDLRRKMGREGAFSPEQVRIWGISLACILIYLHGKSIWYLDMKPSNVMCREDGSLVLVDFGAARIAGDGEGKKLGTKGYASPEQMQGGTVDARSDIYSLGAMLYHLRTGNMYGGQIIGEDSFLAPVLRRCLAEMPGRRYGTAQELLRDLLDAKEGRFRRRIWSAVTISMVGMSCLAVWGTFGALNLQRHMKAKEVREELQELSDGENLCLIFPKKRDGYCMELAECTKDGVMDPWEAEAFLELCERIPPGEERSCLEILAEDRTEYEVVMGAAADAALWYGSWEMAELFLLEERRQDREMILLRKELLSGISQDYDTYLERLVQWQEGQKQAQKRVLREAAMFFWEFCKQGLREEVKGLWENADTLVHTPEWELLGKLLQG